MKDNGGKKKKDNPLNFYARYSTLAMQMIVIILAGVFGGMALDRWIGWEFPVFTLILTILAVIMSMIYGTRDLLNKK